MSDTVTGPVDATASMHGPFYHLLLHALEGGSPQLFIDNLDLLSRRAYLNTGNDAASGMDVSFDLYGYLKSAPATGNRRG